MEDFFLVVESDRVHLGLGLRLHGGGEADIRPVPAFKGCVAKIYHLGTHASHASRSKVEAMMAKRPEHMTNRANGVDLPQFAWPTQIVEDASRNFRGFLMREVPKESSELLSSYMSRAQMHQTLSKDDCSLPRRVLVCANLASAITELHRIQHFFVDIKPANIAMFKDTGILCLLDNDSFSIAGEDCRFPATAFTREYLAPELILNELSASAVITDWQDRFALAVLIFQILNNGLHPFQGVPMYETEEWNIDMCVKQGLYAYGLVPNTLVSAAPASIHTTWPVALREMFDRAFVGRQGSKRPSAKEWRDLLQSFQRTFERCDAQPDSVLHIHFSGMPCQECLFEEIAARNSEKSSMQRAAQDVAREMAQPPNFGPSERDRTPNSRPSANIAAPTATVRTQLNRGDTAAANRPSFGTAHTASHEPSAGSASVPGGRTSVTSGSRRTRYRAAALTLLAAAALVAVYEFSTRPATRPYEPSTTPEAAPAPAATPVPAGSLGAGTAAPLMTDKPRTASPGVPARDEALSLARNVQGDGDTDGINARIEVIRRAMSLASDQNLGEMMQIIQSGIAGDDAKTLSDAQTLMRNTDFISAYADWNYTRGLGRAVNDSVLLRFKADRSAAVGDQFKALALAPVDRELAANFAYYLALAKQKGSMTAAIYALSLPRPTGLTGTSSAWQVVGVAFALAGKPRESEGAFDVGLAITSKLPAFCKNLLTYQRDIGSDLNAPITAVFKRINERGQSNDDNCAYPPRWLQ